MKHIKVLVVDDSATMRSLIAAALRTDPAIDVVGQAADALEARQAIKQLNPDVVTLDIEMPNMNGLDFLEKIMRLRPMPVIMISTLTGRHAAATIEALEIGAFDCIAKSSLNQPLAAGALIDTVKAAARSKPRLSGLTPETADVARPEHMSASYKSDGKLVAIGASTGGVEALITVLSQFPANCPPTVITQHMPGIFTRSFAERLDRLCRPRISEAKNGAILSEGQIYLAPGGATHLEVVGFNTMRCRLTDSDLVNGHRPSVDVLFSSVAKYAGANAVGVVLTGMGRDGAAGMLRMRQAGAATIGQNEQTSLVYGMPKVAFEIGAVECQLPLKKIGSQILALTQTHSDGENHVVRTTSQSARSG